MSSLYRRLATSNSPWVRAAKSARNALLDRPLPAPRPVVLPLLGVYLLLRSVVYFVRQRLIAEPLFKAYCTTYGRRLRTGVFVHWVQGRGRIVIGDDVLVDGKCSFSFAARYADEPTLSIGDRTGIGHNCTFIVGRAIRIGADCRIASDVWIFDVSGHPSDPADRRAGLPAPLDTVAPVTIGDNVWIGSRCIVFPGVTIGAGSVVSAGSVVMADVPPNTMVAGNPARRVSQLKPEAAPLAPATAG